MYVNYLPFVAISDVETQNYGLTDIPTQLAFTISNNDAWG